MSMKNSNETWGNNGCKTVNSTAFEWPQWNNVHAKFRWKSVKLFITSNMWERIPRARSVDLLSLLQRANKTDHSDSFNLSRLHYIPKATSQSTSKQFTVLPSKHKRSMHFTYDVITQTLQKMSTILTSPNWERLCNTSAHLPETNEKNTLKREDIHLTIMHSFWAQYKTHKKFPLQK